MLLYSLLQELGLALYYAIVMLLVFTVFQGIVLDVRCGGNVVFSWRSLRHGRSMTHFFHSRFPVQHCFSKIELFLLHRNLLESSCIAATTTVGGTSDYWDLENSPVPDKIIYKHGLLHQRIYPRNKALR
jgi:hypothetical protein